MTRGKLEIVFGPMFSGKTTELIRRIDRHRVIGNRVLVLNSSLDSRCGDEVKSHNAECVEAKKVRSLLDEITEDDIRNIDVVAIDESQFFTDLVPFVEWIVQKGLDVLVMGLNGDFQQKKFGHILELIPISDEVTQLHGLCTDCSDGTHGNFSVRCTLDQEQTMIGAKDTYKCVCHRHLVQ